MRFSWLFLALLWKKIILSRLQEAADGRISIFSEDNEEESNNIYKGDKQ
jgi:hypothetical protein